MAYLNYPLIAPVYLVLNETDWLQWKYDTMSVGWLGPYSYKLDSFVVPSHA